MNTRQVPPTRVPTLTEVVRLPEGGEVAVPTPPPPPPDPMIARPPAAAPFVERRAGWPQLSEDQIVQRVLSDLQRQIDLMLEVKLREVLAPVLTRATDTMLRDARAELASTLRDVVARAVEQELSRHRGS
ncbi:MAG: hypothetical protein KF788_19620 [Piscinibacter sp.]|nr:hypothetical protein [Piscinibacter sp.]